MFWSGGLAALADFDGFTNIVSLSGLPVPALVTVAVIITNLLGSALLITNFRNLGWLGAGALAVFTLATIPISHDFWNMTGERQAQEIQIAVEHLSVVGGLFLAAITTLPRRSAQG